MSKLKVLYLGHYRDGTGYGNAAIGYIRSLVVAGYDVYCQPLRLNKESNNAPEDITRLEKDVKFPDVCIQHTLPHNMYWNGKCGKNIGLFAWETSHFNLSTWSHYLECMDSIWVPSQVNKNSIPHNLQEKTSIVHHAVDIDIFKKEYEPPKIPNVFDTDFKFYFIGELNKRKNLDALMKAYMLEFGHYENVKLIVKTHKGGIHPVHLTKKLEELENGIKNHLKLRNTPDILFCADRLSHDDLMSIHKYCDCFVMPSYGEAWNIPAMDAMGFGNTPVVTADTGMSEFINDDNGFLIPSQKEPCSNMGQSFEDIYTGYETWQSINIEKLRQCMRRVFNDNTLRKIKGDNGKKDIYKYSYDSVGSRIKDLLR